MMRRKVFCLRYDGCLFWGDWEIYITAVTRRELEVGGVSDFAVIFWYIYSSGIKPHATVAVAAVVEC